MVLEMELMAQFLYGMPGEKFKLKYQDHLIVILEECIDMPLFCWNEACRT
jgi:hypothetical protein